MSPAPLYQWGKQEGREGRFESENSSGTGTNWCETVVDKFALEKEDKHLGSRTIRAVKAKNLSSFKMDCHQVRKECLDIMWQWQGLDTATQERLLQAY